MNRKDVQKMAAEKPSQAVDMKELEAAIGRAIAPLVEAVNAQQKPAPVTTPAQMRAQIYVAAVGGQCGWIVDALGDDRRLNYRLEALYRVADAAARHAMLNRLI
jgi:hypothetical protein